MELNKTDFVLMYAIGFAMFLILTFGTAGIAMATSLDLNNVSILPYIFFITLYGIPLGFYFYRNQSEFKEAAAVSFSFGATIIPLMLMIFFIISYFLLSVVFMFSGNGAGSTMLLPGVTDWIAFITELVVNGILVSLMGVPLWFIIREVKGEKQFQDIKEDLTEDYQNFLNSFGKPKKYYRKRRRSYGR